MKFLGTGVPELLYHHPWSSACLSSARRIFPKLGSAIGASPLKARGEGMTSDEVWGPRSTSMRTRKGGGAEEEGCEGRQEGPAAARIGISLGRQASLSEIQTVKRRPRKVLHGRFALFWFAAVSGKRVFAW